MIQTHQPRSHPHGMGTWPSVPQMFFFLYTTYFCCSTILWRGQFGFGVKFGLFHDYFLTTGNAAVVSGLSVYWLAVSGICDLVAPNSFLADSRHGNLNFRRVIYFRFRSGFCFRSHFYIRDSGGTTASPSGMLTRPQVPRPIAPSLKAVQPKARPRQQLDQANTFSVKHTSSYVTIYILIIYSCQFRTRTWSMYMQSQTPDD